MCTYRELDLDFPEELIPFKEEVHRFAREVLRPAAAELDRLANPSDAVAEGSPLWRVFRTAYALGYHRASLPIEVGGLGLDGVAQHVMLEEMGWGGADLACSLGVTSFPFTAVAASGDRALIRELVEPFVADREARFIGCWAITEPSHGSDELAVGSPEFHDPAIAGGVCARSAGDDYVITGQKSAWVSNGTIATHALVYLELDKNRGMAGGGIAVVPLDLPGVSKGKPIDKLGQRALNQGEIFFDDVRIPRRYMLRDSSIYENALTMTLVMANAGMGAVFTGVARAAYEDAVVYARSRVQGGKPISEHQLVQKQLFEMFTRVEACRALSRAALVYNQSAFPPAIEYSIAAKTFCTQAAFDVANAALQLFGGNGLSRDYPVEKIFRDARASLIEDGTNEVLSLIGARQLLAQA